MLGITPQRKNYMPGINYYTGGYFYMDCAVFGGLLSKDKTVTFNFSIKINEDDLGLKYKDNRPDAKFYFSGRTTIQFSFPTERIISTMSLDGKYITPKPISTKIKDSYGAFYSASVYVVDKLSEGKHKLILKFK